MRILFVGDIIGRPGRRVVRDLLPRLRDEERIDLCLANGENGAGGFGLTPEVADELFELGIDVLTSGNHIWDKQEILPYLKENRRVLRPANYPPGVAGEGYCLVDRPEGPPVIILNLQGRVFMPETDCPFRTADTLLEQFKGRSSLIVVDFHAEATSEKMAMGWYLDGRVSACVGTHTHVQTADERILPRGTAYLSDLGMTGSIDSVIGIRTELVLERFLRGTKARFDVATKNLWLMGAIVDLDEESGRAAGITRVQQRLEDADR